MHVVHVPTVPESLNNACFKVRTHFVKQRARIPISYTLDVLTIVARARRSRTSTFQPPIEISTAMVRNHKTNDEDFVRLTLNPP